MSDDLYANPADGDPTDDITTSARWLCNVCERRVKACGQETCDECDADDIDTATTEADGE